MTNETRRHFMKTSLTALVATGIAEAAQEHAYHMDYGAAAAKYIDAFLANVQWDAVGQRMDTA